MATAHLTISSSVSYSETGASVTCTLYYHGNGASWSDYQKTWKIKFNGTTKSGTHSFTKSTSSQKLGSATFSVNRETWAQSIKPSATFNCSGTSLGTLSVTGSAISIPARNIYTVYTSGSTGGTTNGNQGQYYGYGVTISATPYAGYSFSYWSDGGAQTHGVTVYGNQSYIAYFSKNYYTLTTSVNNNLMGQVTPGEQIQFEASKLITATENSGYHFVKWSGANDSTDNPLNFVMGSSNVSLVANFEPNTYSVHLYKNDGSDNYITQDFIYDIEQTLTKKPDDWIVNNYNFAGWSIEQKPKQDYHPEEEYKNYIDYSDEEVVKNLTNINKDVIKLYAVWILKAYPVNIKPFENQTGYAYFKPQLPKEKTVFPKDNQDQLNRTGYHRQLQENTTYKHWLWDCNNKGEHYNPDIDDRELTETGNLYANGIDSDTSTGWVIFNGPAEVDPDWKANKYNVNYYSNTGDNNNE